MSQATIRWRVTGKSVRGASHSRRGLPNQDAVLWIEPASPQDHAILAVADGHGSARYVRSHKGAKLAVQGAVAALDAFAREQVGLSLSATKRLALERMPRLLVRTWTERVHAHLSNHPIQPDEWRAIEERAGSDARRRIEDDPSVAYGATVIATLLTEQYMFYLQLGDGDILTVAAGGTVTRPPLPEDARLMANQTTSLCTPDAWADVRMHFQSLADRPPHLILLATDGYSNSFADDEGFLALGGDLLAAVRERGLDAVQRQLAKWLAATSAAGSGDDITLGLAYREQGLT